MILSRIEILCLNEICDDYENVEIISKGVSESFHSPVEKSEVIGCLKRLVREKLMNVFEYDQVTKRLKEVVLSENADIRDMWFKISEQGRHELDLNWDKKN